MAVVLLDLVEKTLRAAKQALGRHTGKPESVRWTCRRDSHRRTLYPQGRGLYTFTELIDRLSLMPEVCGFLGFHPDALPDSDEKLSFRIQTKSDPT